MLSQQPSLYLTIYSHFQYAVECEDIAAFERYMSQLLTYYADYADVLEESAFKYGCHSTFSNVYSYRSMKEYIVFKGMSSWASTYSACSLSAETLSSTSPWKSCPPTYCRKTPTSDIQFSSSSSSWREITTRLAVILRLS